MCGTAVVFGLTGHGVLTCAAGGDKIERGPVHSTCHLCTLPPAPSWLVFPAARHRNSSQLISDPSHPLCPPPSIPPLPLSTTLLPPPSPSHQV